MKKKRSEGGRKERRKEKREGKGDYIFQCHQKKVKIDKLRNNSINLLLRNMEEIYQECLKVIK